MTTALVIKCPACDCRFVAFESREFGRGNKCDDCGKEVPPGVLNFSKGYEKQRKSIRDRDSLAQ